MGQRKRKRGRPKKTKQKQLKAAPLVEFLNYAPGQPSSWILSWILRDHADKDIAQTQEKLISELLPLTVPPTTYENADTHLQEICRKLDSFEYIARFSALPADKDNPFGDQGANARALLGSDQKLAKWGKHSWAVTPHSYTIKKTDSLEKKLYSLVAAGLQRGELGMLRRCQQCNCFFVADEMRQTFCSRTHARNYYDAPERASERVRTSRKRRKKTSLDARTAYNKPAQ